MSTTFEIKAFELINTHTYSKQLETFVDYVLVDVHAL